ncbi:MAG TPA: hypothetical protein VND98_02855 [Solirubrobacterales bacterium]|nr:hypothetical protein [Solirubrobacterales bacterium]
MPDVQADRRLADDPHLGRLDWRTIGIAVLMPIAVLVGTVGPRYYLPRHGGWYLAAVLLILGAVFGLRAVLLALIGSIAAFIRGQTACVTDEECGVGVAILILYPILFSISAVVGALVGAVIRTFGNRFANPS